VPLQKGSSGAVQWNEEVDTNGKGGPDTRFHVAMQAAESVRLDPNATPAHIDAQRAIVGRINNTI
jgi:hypothetical protein